jgi:hypothetical protein
LCFDGDVTVDPTTTLAAIKDHKSSTSSEKELMKWGKVQEDFEREKSALSQEIT